MNPRASVDQVARDAAASALSEIKAHQRECAERQKNIDGKLDASKEQRDKIEKMVGKVAEDTQQSFGRLYRFLWRLVGALIGLLVSVVAFLLVQIFFMPR